MIEVDRLTKRFRKVLAVDDLSFKVREGAITGFLGPNGAGKTTTLRIILGLVRATAGKATVMDRLYRELESPTRQVGAVLEASDFHPGRSGRNHLRVLATATGMPRSRVEEVLELVDLKDAAARRAGGYSLGMRQRLSLAGALLGDPKVLVLDEPANGLDPQGIRWLRELLRSLAAEGRTIFISSHVLAEVEQIVDEVVIIHRGEVRRAGDDGRAGGAGRRWHSGPEPAGRRASCGARGSGGEGRIVRGRSAHGCGRDDSQGGGDRRREGHRPARARGRELLARAGVPRPHVSERTPA